VFKIFRIMDSDVKRRRIRNQILTTCVATIFTASIFLGGAKATTLGQFNSAGSIQTGEFLEPSVLQPVISQDVDSGEASETYSFGQTPPFAISNPESIDGTNFEFSEEQLLSRLNNSHLDQFMGLINDPTSLEWVAQLSETGYWLENNQWADFKALAIAGYSPNIKYWLSGNQWASFRATTTTNSYNESSPRAPGEPKSTNGHYRSTSPSFQSAQDTSFVSRSAGRSQKFSSTPVTVQEFLTSMAKKIIYEPVFYVVLLFGLGLLIWAIRRPADS
jgi:hypothetical protein